MAHMTQTISVGLSLPRYTRKANHKPRQCTTNQGLILDIRHWAPRVPVYQPQNKNQSPWTLKDPDAHCVCHWGLATYMHLASNALYHYLVAYWILPRGCKWVGVVFLIVYIVCVFSFIFVRFEVTYYVLVNFVIF